MAQRRRTDSAWLAVPLLVLGLAFAGCSGPGTAALPPDGGRRDGAADRAVPDLRRADRGVDSAKDSSVEGGAADLLSRDIRTPDVQVVDLWLRDRGVDAPQTVVLGNGVCSSPGALNAGPAEEGHLSAVRLTPKTYPFTITHVRYALMPPPPATPNGCATGIDHRVDLFITSTVAPPASPTILRSVTVPRTSDGTTIKVLEHDVTPPLVLAQGDHLYVAVQMRYTAKGEQLCLRACFPVSAPLDRDYWSNAKQAPYPWVELQSFGFVAYSSTQALGYAP